jgi:5'(3')-deoxyribonucleotidase
METVETRPTIAIDVDGVLRNNLGIMVHLYNKEFDQKMKISDVKEFMVEKSFPLIPERLGMKSSEYFFNLHAKEIFLDAPVYPNVKECIDNLKETADVIIVTYQKDYTNKRYTLEWLEKNGIEPNGICFLRDKTLVHANVLVDDNDWNFIGTHCHTSILVTQPYNKKVSLVQFISQTNSTQMMRVSSLQEFTDKYLNGEILL